MLSTSAALASPGAAWQADGVDVAHDWGSTEADRAHAFACDGLLAEPADTLWRAIDVEAPPATLFRWLCQLRAAPYSYDWIDNLGRQSPQTLTPGLEALAVGQRVMTIFDLVAFEADRHLTLRLRRGGGLFGDVAVTYRIVPRGAEGSRLVVKMRWRHPSAVVTRLLAWGDLVMMRKQLLNLKALAERDYASARATSSSARAASSDDCARRSPATR